MFVRMLTVHCYQNSSYEITINGFQVKKIKYSTWRTSQHHCGDWKLRFLFRLFF